MIGNYAAVLRDCSLFTGLSFEDTARLIEACGGICRSCGAEESLIFEGQVTDKAGILLDGTLYAEKTTSDGNAFILHILSPGSLFGDILGGAGTASPVRVYSPGGAVVLLIPYRGILDAAGAGLPCYRKFLDNFISEISNKYFVLHKRLDILLCRSLREKINIFLHDCMAGKKASLGKKFELPFDRSAMAEYLCCDRSALSRELSRMKKEGLIDFKGKSFTVKNTHMNQKV